MATKYLDSVGVSYLWNKIKNYVSTAVGNVFAFIRITDGTTEVTADASTKTIQFTGGTNVTVTTQKDANNNNAKVTITTSAEPNQNAFSNVKVGNTTVAADSKTDTLEFAAGTGANGGITIEADATNDKLTIKGKSETAAYGGTNLSMVTTGEKYEWGNKIDKAAYASSGSLAMFNAVGNVEDSNISHTDVVTLTGSQDLTNKTYNGYTLAGACAKGVDTSIASGSTSTNVPTTAAVESRISAAIEAAQAGAAMYQGTAPTTFAPTNYKAGYYWIVGTAGTYAGQVCESGDMIFANTSSATYSASHFDVIQTNLDIAAMTNSEIDAATDQTPNP